MRAIAACLDEVLRMGREAAQRQGTGGNLENRVGRAADNPAVPAAGLDGDVGIRVIYYDGLASIASGSQRDFVFQADSRRCTLGIIKSLIHGRDTIKAVGYVCVKLHGVPVALDRCDQDRFIRVIRARGGKRGEENQNQKDADKSFFH